MNTDRKTRRSRKAPYFATLALACSMAVGNAGATIPVADVGNMPNHIITQISSYISQIQAFTEYGTEAYREVERLRNLATQASSLVNPLANLAMTNPQRRSVDHGMERCAPDFSGFSLADLFRLVAPSLTSSIPEQQREICKQIVRLENEKYNENVKLLENIRQRGVEISRLQSQLRGSSTSGAVDTNMAAGTVALNELNRDMQYAEAITRVYDTTISSLKEDQKYLAEQALHGKKKGLGESLLATATQTATLCGGLMAAASDDSDFECL